MTVKSSSTKRNHKGITYCLGQKFWDAIKVKLYVQYHQMKEIYIQTRGKDY